MLAASDSSLFCNLLGREISLLLKKQKLEEDKVGSFLKSAGDDGDFFSLSPSFVASSISAVGINTH